MVGTVLPEPLLVDELPGIRSIEAADPNCGEHTRVKVSEVHAVLGTRLWIQRLPVCDTATGLAVNGSKRLVTPDVLRRVFRVPFNLDGPKFVIDPRPTNSAAQRAVAGGSDLWSGRQRD